MKLGFTGSRNGMTEAQAGALVAFFLSKQIEEFHHGDCVGADARAHGIVRQVVPKARIIIHPPFDSKLRAFTNGDVILPCRSYLIRNEDIVDACDMIIATPDGLENSHSGTWHTIRYARKRAKPVEVFS